jgi:NAD(P)-dependent dehydrogenase (short-subunit alcohol dehydrogenase family)
MEKLRNLTDDFDNLHDWMIVCGDVANESDCKNLLDLTIKKFGKLDVLINNSVTVMRDGMSQHSLPEFDELLSINLHAIGFLSEICAPYLVKNRGKILNVNTLSAFFQVDIFNYK